MTEKRFKNVEENLEWGTVQYFTYYDEKITDEELEKLVNHLLKENEQLKQSVKRQQSSNNECAKLIKEQQKENEQLKQLITELQNELNNCEEDYILEEYL